MASYLWRLQKKKGGGIEREKISFQFQLYFIWVFKWLLCSEECLPGQFENRCFSKIRCWIISHPNSVWSCPVVFSCCLLWHVGLLAADTNRMRSPRDLTKLACYLASSQAGKSPFSLRGPTEMSDSLFFTWTVPFFVHASLHFLSGAFGSFCTFFIYFIHSHSTYTILCFKKIFC